MSPAPSAPVRAIALRPRSSAAILLMSVVGVAAFGWPLLVDPGAGLAHGTDAPLLFAMLLPLLLAVVLAEVGEGGLDVKAVAAKVTLGEADAGIVYVTDVTPRVAGKVQTIAIPAPFNQVAQYPIAVTKNADNAALAQRFVDYVQSSAGKAALRDRGFLIGSPAATYATSFQVSGLVASPISFTANDLRKLPVTTVTVERGRAVWPPTPARCSPPCWPGPGWC